MWVRIPAIAFDGTHIWVGDICYRAFKAVAEEHNFSPDFPSPDMAAAFLAGLISHEGFFDTVAEIDGRIVGSNFLDERNPISGVGPVTVDPALQNDGAGRALMQAAMRRSRERGFAGIRLVQAGYHYRSLALYIKLGFEAREQYFPRESDHRHSIPARSNPYHRHAR
jgi:GNAT superfamily N-acetyltransferase